MNILQSKMNFQKQVFQSGQTGQVICLYDISTPRLTTIAIHKRILCPMDNSNFIGFTYTYNPLASDVDSVVQHLNNQEPVCYYATVKSTCSGSPL